MSLSVNINYKLETSDHDGYCSGDECVYSCNHHSLQLDINKDDIVRDDNGDITNLQSYERFIPKPVVHGESQYCGLSDESFQHGLDIHEYRITVTSVTIL